jgi:DNA-binding CsgD family transcriptional regulator
MKLDQTLTDKEMDILLFFAMGMTKVEVGSRFMISEKTVRVYLTHIYHKIGVKKLHQAIVWYFEHELSAKASESQLRTFGAKVRE